MYSTLYSRQIYKSLATYNLFARLHLYVNSSSHHELDVLIMYIFQVLHASLQLLTRDQQSTLLHANATFLLY